MELLPLLRAVPATLAPQADAPSWSWLVLALLGACAVALWVIVARLTELERRLGARAKAEDGAGGPGRPGLEEPESRDLRRVEQLLQELRDGSKRLEDALLRSLAQARAAQGAAGLLASSADPAVDLGERVTNRLLALGYERVVVVTPREQFAAILQGGGDVLVEARRDGAACKGKAIFRGGALVDVTMQSAYATFP